MRATWNGFQTRPNLGCGPLPYGTLKEYPAHKGQLGFVEDYDKFHDELEKVWKHCLRGLLTTA